jgi:hypothetical protein
MNNLLYLIGGFYNNLELNNYEITARNQSELIYLMLQLEFQNLYLKEILLKEPKYKVEIQNYKERLSNRSKKQTDKLKGPEAIKGIGLQPITVGAGKKKRKQTRKQRNKRSKKRKTRKKN